MSSKVQKEVETNLKELLGIESTNAPEAGVVVTPSDADENLPDKIDSSEVLPALVDSMQDIDQDYNFARNNIREAIIAQQKMIKDLETVAAESEKARDFEVLGVFAQQIIEANHGLMDLQLKYQKLKEYQEKDPNAPSSVTNVAYIGTAAELQELIKGRRNETSD